MYSQLPVKTPSIPYANRMDAAKGDQMLMDLVSVQAIQKRLTGTAGADTIEYHSRHSGAVFGSPARRSLSRSFLTRAVTRGMVAEEITSPMAIPMKHGAITP